MSEFFDAEQTSRLRAPHSAKTIDLSLVSRALEPFWQACAAIVPPHVAPNAITLSGLALVALSFVAMVMVNPTFERAAPGAVHVFAIVAIFAFQTLDAIDGKQARKTKSSSALGNWCDHACDVAAVQLAMAAAGGAIGLGAGGAMLFLLGSVIVNNYVVHWETRHTNTLYMGNGTSIYEAQLMMMAVHAITFFVGVEPWGRALGDLVPFARALPFADAPVRLWLVVVGVGAIGGVGIVGSFVRVARAGVGAKVFVELAPPAVLCAAGAAAVWSTAKLGGPTLPFVFSVSLFGLRMIAQQILGQLVGSRMKLADPVLFPFVATAALVTVAPGVVGSLGATVTALAWSNLAFAVIVGVRTYVRATFAIARALDLPILTLPRR